MNDPKIICEVLGSKYTLQRNSGDPTVPKSLYILTAQLLQHGLISLDDIYVWLIPDDKVMQKECEKDLKDAKEYVRKLQIISINQKDKEEPVEEKENKIDKYNANQKLGLCQALVAIGDWENSLALIKRLPEHFAVEQQQIALEICKLLHGVVEPLYRE